MYGVSLNEKKISKVIQKKLKTLSKCGFIESRHNMMTLELPFSTSLHA